LKKKYMIRTLYMYFTKKDNFTY